MVLGMIVARKCITHSPRLQMGRVFYCSRESSQGLQAVVARRYSPLVFNPAAGYNGLAVHLISGRASVVDCDPP